MEPSTLEPPGGTRADFTNVKEYVQLTGEGRRWGGLVGREGAWKGI